MLLELGPDVGGFLFQVGQVPRIGDVAAEKLLVQVGRPLAHGIQFQLDFPLLAAQFFDAVFPFQEDQFHGIEVRRPLQFPLRLRLPAVETVQVDVHLLQCVKLSHGSHSAHAPGRSRARVLNLVGGSVIL